MIFKNDKQGSIRKIGAILLLMQFFVYFAGTTLFWHRHTFYGMTFVHSHPFPIGEDSKMPTHTHSFDELQYLDTIAKIAEFTAFALIVICGLFAAFKPTAVRRTISEPDCRSKFGVRSLRAPPAFSL